MSTQPPHDDNGEPDRSRFRLRDLTIGRKVMIGLGFLVVLTFLGAGISWYGSNRATAKIDMTGDTRVPAALVAARAQADLLRMLSDVRGYLALGDQEYQDSYDRYNAAFQADLAELDTLLNRDPDAASLKRFIQIKVAYEQWAQLPATLFELRNDQLEREPAYRLLATDGVRTAGQVLIDTNSLIEAQSQQAATVDNMALMEDMAKFQGNFAAMLSALRGYVATRNRIFKVYEYEANLTANENSWDRLLAKRRSLTTDQQKLLDTIAQNREAFLILPDEIFDLAESERWREDLYLFRTEAVPLAETMQQLLNELTNDQQNRLKAELAAGRADLATANRLILASGVVALAFGMLMIYLAQATIAAPVRRLTRVAEQVRSGDLEARAAVESADEIGALAGTFNRMTGQLRSTIVEVRKEKKRADDLLQVVIPIGIDLASEKNFNRLLEKMLLEAKQFCHAQAGTLYLRTDDGCLRFVILRNDALGLALGGTTGRTVTLAPLPLTDPASGEPNDRSAVARCALTGEPVNVADAAQSPEFDFTGRDSQNLDLHPYSVVSMLVIPLKASQGQVLGVLQLLNAQDPETGEVAAFDANLQQMMQSFSSLAVAALEAYIREQALQQQIQQLRIEIDEVKRQRQVEEITDTGFFADLQQKARRLRAARAGQAGQE